MKCIFNFPSQSKSVFLTFLTNLTIDAYLEIEIHIYKSGEKLSKIIRTNIYIHIAYLMSNTSCIHKYPKIP